MSCIRMVRHLSGLVRSNLCPCVLKLDDNSAELASLIEVNKKYQVSRERALRPHRNCCVVGLLWLANEVMLTLSGPQLSGVRV